MVDLCAALEGLGLTEVSSYGHAGNVWFDSKRALGTLEAAISRHLVSALELEVEVMVRTRKALEALVASDPFSESRGDPDLKLYVAFLARPPASPKALRSSVKDGLEVLSVGKSEILLVSRPVRGRYGFPNAYVEALGVTATTRNWNTVVKLAEGP